MRILANENMPGDAVAALRVRGHDVVWVRTEMPELDRLDLAIAHSAELGQAGNGKMACLAPFCSSPSSSPPAPPGHTS